MARKPKEDSTMFLAYWQPVYRVISCDEKLAEETRGMMGFHRYTSCPNCRRIFEGWELWGENGHKQGGAPASADPWEYLENRLRRDRKLEVTGAAPLYYRGN